MSAIVCGKRSFFEDSQQPSSPPASKKLRCFSSNSSPVRFPPSPSLVDKLRSVFPNMDKQLLEEALEKSGNDLDSAIRSLTELSLGFVNGATGSPAQLNTITVKGSVTDGENIPKNGEDWVELLVTEVTSATSIDDARLRVMGVLESLEKSITKRAAGDAAEHLQKENITFKGQLEVLLKENAILKRAVAIQHERQKECDERTVEVQQLKQLLSQHQEQLRTLQVNNYALTMHLRQAQGNNSIPGRFHPDIF